ncbi:hypothetical protein HPP92_017997 [Vanilla planifolia]|uniref:FAS1 domain-containing protein n=1 Tax=Vanilla planifolia TaxID=51239 RepID=A0A835UMG0_VANPL|nr:hypothetical protein HPP92_017997 [Vanilla planifolia]
MATLSILHLLLSTTLLMVPSMAHNIALLLDDVPNFSNFNSLLSETKVADEINRLNTITVLAVPNSAMSSVAAYPVEVKRRILSVHVILDYYDPNKLHTLTNHSTIVTTLFQSSGIAENNTGYLNVAKFDDGPIAFISAAITNATPSSNFLGSIAARPYNISVLHVGSIIVPPGIDRLNHPTFPSPPPSKAPTMSPTTKAPTIAPTTGSLAESPVADAPRNSSGAGAGATNTADDKDDKSETSRLATKAGHLLMVALLIAFISLS